MTYRKGDELIFNNGSAEFHFTVLDNKTDPMLIKVVNEAGREWEERWTQGALNEAIAVADMEVIKRSPQYESVVENNYEI